MSKHEGKGYKFTIGVNNTVMAVYEIERGKAKLKKMESDETWSYDGTQVVKTELDDGETEITTYTDLDNDGVFTKTSEVKSPNGISGSAERYKFDLANSVTYELYGTKWKAERISANESFTLQGTDVVKVETEHGFVETTTYTDEDGDGLFIKASKSYARNDGSTITYLDDGDHGGDDDDHWSGSDSDDFYYGAAGNDMLAGGSGNDDLSGGLGNDTLSGGDGDDVLYAAAGNDTVDGGTGDDLIIGGDGAGNDTYKGGAGIDTVKYTSAKAGISVNLSQTIGIAGSLNTKVKDASGIGADKLFDIENIIAGSYSDNLTGSIGSNSIDGGAGNDTLSGGLGNDVLTGGDGSDRFIFNSKLGSANIDTIRDFGDDNDKIVLNKAIFKSLSKGVKAENLVTGTSAQLATHSFDKNDFLVYNSETHALIYDADGSGKLNAIEFAHIDLVGISNLTHTDFIIT